MDQLDALYDAAIAGDVDAVAKLEMEADILNHDEQTILHVESKNGNTERVRFIVREFASKNLLVKLDNQQETALMWAAYLGHTEVVEVLIDAARNLPPFSPNDDGVSSFQAFLRQGDKDSDTALHSAVFQGNVDIVKLLVEADPTDPHTQNDDGKTPMYIAVEKEYNEIVEIISTACTAPSLDGPDGSTVVRVKNLYQVESRGGTLYKIMDRDDLYDAAISGDADVIAILEMKADILNEYGETILHIESESGNTEHVQFILREFVNKNFLGKLNRFQQTALHLAVSNGHTEVAKVIIEAAQGHMQEASFQAFLRQGDQDMDTALHVAVMERNVDIVKLLVEADRTDTHTQNELGETPMYIAVEKEYNEIIELISATCTAPSLDGPEGSSVVRINNLDQDKSPGGALYKIMDRDALFDAAIAGDAVSIAKLEMEADKLDRYNGTILHIESINGNTEHVRFILREFANKNLLDKLGNQKETALIVAAYYGHTEVVEVLIEAARHLPPSAIDNPITSFQDYLRHADQDSETALHAAVKEGRVDVVKLLVVADPTDTHIQNKDGKTPMYIAVEQRYKEIVEIISSICTAPTLDGPDGRTALHAAVLSGNNSIDVVKVLIDAAGRLPPSAPDNDNSDSIPVASLQPSSASDHDNTDDDNDDDDDDDSTEDNTDPNRVTSFQASSSDNNSTDDNPVSSVQAFLRRVDEDGNTALHIAVKQRNLDTAKLLVESDPSYEGTPNKKGQTPFYIAVANGYADAAKMIGTACTTPEFLYGPGGNISALHAVIRYLDEENNEVKDVIEMVIDQIKKHNINAGVDEIFYETDEDGCTILEVAVELNKEAVINFILDLQHPASKRKDGAFISLMPIIYKAQEKNYKNIVKLLTDRYNDGSKLSKDFKDQVSLISAIRSGKTDAVFDLLVDGRGAQRLVTFVDKLGWTALHHAVYHESNPIIKHIAEAQKGIKHKSGYQNKSKTDMIEGILKNCPEEHKKKEFVNKQNNDGNTTLHLLIQRGCFVPELLKYEGLDISVENMEKWTPWDMLYFHEQIFKDQVKIRVALEYIQIDRKRDIFLSSVFPIGHLEKKDVSFREEAKKMIDEMLALMKVNTGAVTKCFADAIAGDPISRAALEMEADKPNVAGETILHVESKKGAIENIRFILSVFANKNLLVRLDNRKQTALSLAAHHGHTKVVDALLSTAKRNLTSSSANDVAPNPVTPFQTYIRQANVPDKNTALHLAVLKNDVAIVKLLVKADPNDKHVENCQGKTPIYIAAEKGYKEIVKEICETCTTLSLDGPGGRTTVLHALIQNIGQVKEGASDIIRTIIHAARRSSEDFEAFFGRTNELGITVLELAVKNNCVDAVRLIVQEDPTYQHGREIKRNGLMPLIFNAIDNKCSDDIIKLLSQTYEVGIINPDHKDVVPLILAMKRRDKDSVLRLLEGTKNLVTFTEDNGWTPLHYAVYHEFDSVLGAIIGAQEDVKHQFVYEIPTPFHVAVERGYTSTLVRLMQLWPAPSSSASRVDNSASGVDNSPYTVVNKDGQNILHLVAADNGNIKADNRKEMVEGILKYCPKSCKEKILKQQDINGDTPLHVLISSGCFIPELIKDEELDTVARNKNNFTPWEMLYIKTDVVADQVLIKIALDDITLGPKSRRNNIFSGSVRTRNNNIFSSSMPPSKRRIKDVLFNERKQKMMKENEPKMKEELERYRQGTNSQIVVSALITTITFTVGFTMPGGLYQSGDDNEGLTVLSKRAAFNAFMIFDAIALLLSACSLFIYFLESMSQNLGQLTKLHATTIVLNIVSVVMMMLVFMTGTYVVLSKSLALAITVCVIGSLFFVFVIVQLLRVVNDYRVQKNKDHEHEA
ncbi:hypothetical protein AgCh_039916 [Apium graveolens]